MLIARFSQRRTYGPWSVTSGDARGPPQHNPLPDALFTVHALARFKESSRALGRDQPWNMLGAVPVPSEHGEDDRLLDAGRIAGVREASKKCRVACHSCAAP